MGKRIGALLHGVADEDKGADPQEPGFLLGVGQDLLDLGMTALAQDPRLGLGERGESGKPAGGPTLVQATIIDELQIEAANASDLTKHLSLEFAGGIPGLVATGGGIQSKDQAAASPFTACSEPFDLGEEAIEL